MHAQYKTQALISRLHGITIRSVPLATELNRARSPGRRAFTRHSHNRAKTNKWGVFDHVHNAIGMSCGRGCTMATRDVSLLFHSVRLFTEKRHRRRHDRNSIAVYRRRRARQRAAVLAVVLCELVFLATLTGHRTEWVRPR